jgi:hypothetical protein
MAQDGKYGRVTFERGTIGEDEPIVVFRAQDTLLLDVLAAYRDMCSNAGAGPFHLSTIDERIEQIYEWQMSHATKLPDTTLEQVEP